MISTQDWPQQRNIFHCNSLDWWSGLLFDINSIETHHQKHNELLSQKCCNQAIGRPNVFWKLMELVSWSTLMSWMSNKSKELPNPSKSPNPQPIWGLRNRCPRITATMVWINRLPLESSMNIIPILWLNINDISNINHRYWFGISLCKHEYIYIYVCVYTYMYHKYPDMVGVTLKYVFHCHLTYIFHDIISHDIPIPSLDLW